MSEEYHKINSGSESSSLACLGENTLPLGRHALPRLCLALTAMQKLMCPSVSSKNVAFVP